MEEQTPQMPCAQVSENLYDYLTGRLTPALRSIIAGHLMSCRACRTEQDEMKITIGLLDQIKPPKLSEGFTEKVMQSLEPKVIPFTKRPAYRLIMQGAAAAIVILAIVSIIKLKPDPDQDTSIVRGGTTTSVLDESCRNAIELYNKGTSNADLKQKEALLKQALAANCTDNRVLARIHNNLADCSEKQGRLDDSIAGYTKALGLDPQLYTAHLGLGDIYKNLEQAPVSISHYRSALELMKRQGVSAVELEQVKKSVEKLQKK